MISFRRCLVLAGAGILVALAIPSLGRAQAISAPSMDALRQQGYVLMDDISLPLLHHVQTGAPYDLRVLAEGDGSAAIMRADHKSRPRARSDDEFDRAAAAASWGAFIEERVAELRAAKGYLVELDYRWGEYDFVHHRFPVKLSMNKHAWRGGNNHFCGGAYQRAGRELRTACVVSPELNKFAAPLSVFPLADTELARQIKQHNIRVAIFAVVEPVGPYKVLKGKEIRYMSSDMGVVAAGGVQPVLITDLLLVDGVADAGPILAVSHVADSRRRPDPAATAMPRQQAQQRWQELVRDQFGAVYVEQGAARREGAVVFAPMLMDFARPPAGALRSSVGLYAFNCAERAVRQLDLKGFDAPMGEGAMLDHDPAPRALPVSSGSNLERMLNHACNL